MFDEIPKTAVYIESLTVGFRKSLSNGENGTLGKVNQFYMQNYFFQELIFRDSTVFCVAFSVEEQKKGEKRSNAFDNFLFIHSCVTFWKYISTKISKTIR